MTWHSLYLRLLERIRAPSGYLTFSNEVDFVQHLDPPAREDLQAGCHVVTYGLPGIEDAHPVQGGNPVFVEPGSFRGSAYAVLRCLRQPRPARRGVDGPDAWRTIAAADAAAILRVGHLSWI